MIFQYQSSLWLSSSWTQKVCTAESDLHYPAFSSTVTNITTQKKNSQANPQEPDPTPPNADSFFADSPSKCPCSCVYGTLCLQGTALALDAE